MKTAHSAPSNELDSSAIDLKVGNDTDISTFSSTSNSAEDPKIDGGSLFAYRVPSRTKDAWKTDPWTRSVIATGFRVKGQLGNMINPGAPGFCYTFYPTKDGPRLNDDGRRSRPLIGIAGDCAEAAYILRPIDGERDNNAIHPDESTKYALMCDIDCGATVGSIGVSYDDFSFVEQQSGYAKIYIPCFEKDKVLVFAMGSVDNDEKNDDDDDGW
uniref:Uncharacterized protein n=1 Tax=Ditylum brightwellii TaxID=49249 RepID=A0A6V2B9F2_9STRA|mmetsp:Transcript_19125/g.27787  ORF Transcript_19125/g.27787 Transcript_19125/m.27787 type:complete len:214 (+) Transcript_19125:1866-2507(+)